MRKTVATEDEDMKNKRYSLENLSEIVLAPNIRNKKRLLILSLGTGNLNPDGTVGYQTVQYSIDGKNFQRNGVDEKTNFVAEPLIHAFSPDEIVILGTVKSAWYAYYASVTTSGNDDNSYLNSPDYQRLIQIREENGINTGLDKLKELEKEITRIFKNVKKWNRFGASVSECKPKIHVLLTRYGVTQKELQDNYQVLKRIESFMETSVDYEVAFDITHSFRSLPLYNLVIINFIKNITKHNVRLTHVYYGNLEAKHELDGKAPIVDLADLVEVLDLTNGVAEFKDTGNCVALINASKDDALTKELKAFDLATQLNAFDKIKESLQHLFELVADNSSADRYTGICEMLGMVLGERFFGNEKVKPDQILSMEDYEIKLCLAKWFFNQNRIGLGLTTGLEALRDMNTPVYMKAFNCSQDDEENCRKRAESFFIRKAHAIKNNPKTELEIAVGNLGVNLKEYKDIRNMFAHSLNNKNNGNLESLSVKIQEFNKALSAVANLYRQDKEEYAKLFIKEKERFKEKTSGDSCRVMIDCMAEGPYDDYKRSNKKKYDVFCLDPRVKKVLLPNGLVGFSREKAFYLYQYLKSNIPDEYQNIHFYLLGCPLNDDGFCLRLLLEQLKTEDTRIHVFILDEGKPDERYLNLELSMEALQKKYYGTDGSYREILAEELVQV